MTDAAVVMAVGVGKGSTTSPSPPGKLSRRSVSLSHLLKRRRRKEEKRVKSSR